jgi:phospholipase/carboxylesterase
LKIWGSCLQLSNLQTCKLATFNLPMQDTTTTINSWVIRIRRPDDVGPYPVILLLHGLTGDENSMGFFIPRLPENYLLIAPRAPYPVEAGGYSWREYDPAVPRFLPSLDDFHRSLDALDALLTSANFPVADFSRLHLMGFSQGAALSFAYALLHPQRVSSVVAMAGFVPPGAEGLIASRPLRGKPVLIAHGRRDETIPVTLAHQAREWMQAAGAEVSYCEDDVGHKMGVKCLPVLEDFFALHA